MKLIQLKENENSRLLYRGAKYFWRDRRSLELLLVDHAKFHCIEVIAYDPREDKKLPSLYLDSAKIKVMNKRSKENNSENFLIDYILARINTNSASSAFNLEIKMNQLYDDKIDEVSGQLETICSKPATLIPFPFHGIRYVPVQEFQKSLQDLNAEQSFITKQFATVHKLMTEVRHVLGYPFHGKDDSFQISPYPSPTHFSALTRRRRSIDDNFILENTSPSKKILIKKDLKENDNKFDIHQEIEGVDEKVSHRGYQPGLKLVHRFGSTNKMNPSLLACPEVAWDDHREASSTITPFPLTPMNTVASLDIVTTDSLASDQQPTTDDDTNSNKIITTPNRIKPRRPMTASSGSVLALPTTTAGRLIKQDSFLDSKPKTLSIKKMKSKKKKSLVRSKTKKDLLSKPTTNLDYSDKKTSFRRQLPSNRLQS